MVDLTFILDGNELIPGSDLERRSLNPLNRAILLAQRNHIRRRLDHLSCPKHGRGPHVTAAGPSADRLTISVDGCCQPLVDEARATLEADTPEYPAATQEAGPAERPPLPERPGDRESVEPGDSLIAPAGRTVPAVEELDGIGGLSDDDERALEAVRRQLNIEFPRVEGTGSPDWEAEDSRGTQRKERSPGRARRVAIVAGACLLVGIAGSVAGVLTTTLRVRGVDAPARVDPVAVADREADREAPPPRLETARTRPRGPGRTRSSSSLRAPGPWTANGVPTAPAPPASVQAP